MLIKYKCKVQPRIDSLVFTYFSDVTHAFNRKRILDKWFYFYINNPIRPVIIWKIKDVPQYQLQPGTNRYIGTALRGTEEWLDGYYITDSDVPNFDELKISNAIDKQDVEDLGPNFDQITLDNPLHVWGVGKNDIHWHQPVFDWISKSLKYTWGLEYNGKTYYVNHSWFKKTKKIFKASDYPSVQLAVQDMFHSIKYFEDIKS
jgi:hypothetical protein